MVAAVNEQHNDNLTTHRVAHPAVPGHDGQPPQPERVSNRYENLRTHPNATGCCSKAQRIIRRADRRFANARCGRTDAKAHESQLHKIQNALNTQLILSVACVQKHVQKQLDQAQKRNESSIMQTVDARMLDVRRNTRNREFNCFKMT